MFQSSAIREIVQEKLREITGISTNEIEIISVGGGSINQTCQIRLGNHSWFCKINSAVNFPRLFEKEKKGLELIGSKAVISVPGVTGCFESGQLQFLLMEWINTGERTKAFWQKFGEQLARMHQVESSQFGWQENNYMGSVVQSNMPESSWNRFFMEQRLQPMVDACYRNKLLRDQHLKQFENLYSKLHQVFDEKQNPVLVHGDLWSGNFICSQDSVPVLIDPAVYFGHPSVDLGMSTLFGGFNTQFYEAYQYQLPFPSNYKEQWEICNLYPLLIHLLLFGSSYLNGIEKTLRYYG